MEAADYGFPISACECFAFEIPQPPEAKTLHVVPLKFTAGQEPGRVAKTLRIETDVSDVGAEISASALVAK